jgi:hypothetical protein
MSLVEGPVRTDQGTPSRWSSVAGLSARPGGHERVGGGGCWSRSPIPRGTPGCGRRDRAHVAVAGSPCGTGLRVVGPAKREAHSGPIRGHSRLVSLVTRVDGEEDETSGVTGHPQGAFGVRPLTGSELALLTAFLRHEFPGVDELRVQARQTSASPGCACGCGTLDLHVPDTVPRSSASSPVPVEGTIVGTNGESIGGLLLFVHDGRLSSLEVYSLVDDPLPMPLPAHVRW